MTDVVRGQGCEIRIHEGRLSVESGLFQRTWRVGDDGLLRAESFLDRVSGIEWLAPPPEDMPKTGATHALRALEGEAGSLGAELTVCDGRTTRRTKLHIFPECQGVRLRTSVEGESTATQKANVIQGASGIEHDGATAGTIRVLDGDVLEALALVPRHLRLTQVTLHDATDGHNELVAKAEWLLHPSESDLRLRGCLFDVEDVLTGAGLTFLKEAPLPDARPVPSPYDLEAHAATRTFTLVGRGTDDAGDGYAFVTLAYTGGRAGRTAALQAYQRALRPYVPARDGLFLSNTWGDRNRDGRINAAFMAREIEAGARLGVDVVQIDDGWETGSTSNSVHAGSKGGVWEGFYAAHDGFWEVNRERFPAGLEPLVREAREKEMRLGLWFGPDSSDDFANWRKDADMILRLHRKSGIDSFKMDGIKLRSKRGERNLRALFERVRAESAGRVNFDLDVTAEVRPGYFGLMGFGPLFVENRYTDWHKYWPHQTLRNLWQLNHHVDPLRLRMEFLNHARHADLYSDDLLAPAQYRPDTLFASVMFASPLGWFETSSLPESYFEEAAPLVATWKVHRERIHSGTILPLGSAPDGVAWTGFASVAPDRCSAYFLAFRELSPKAEWTTDIPLLVPSERAIQSVCLGGEGEATLFPAAGSRPVSPRLGASSSPASRPFRDHNRKLNVALLGFGFGSCFAETYLHHPDVRSLTLCDADPKRLNRLAGETGTARTARWQRDRMITSSEQGLWRHR